LDFKEKKRMGMSNLTEIMNNKMVEMKALKSIRPNRV